MDFTRNITLENEKVLLRPLEENDFDHLLVFSENEPETWKYSLLQASGAGALKRYIALALEGRAKEKEYPFIVYDKAVQRYAGSTRFYDIQPASQSTQLGYTWYGKAFRGTGLNKQCKFLMLEHAFTAMKMERVEFRADANNERSIAAMKSIGCRVEGILRSSGPSLDGGRRDSIVLSILKAEWEKDLKQALRNKLKDRE